jgi:hypothetical protein
MRRGGPLVVSFLRRLPFDSIVRVGSAVAALSSIVESRLLCDRLVVAGAAARKLRRAVVTAVLQR